MSPDKPEINEELLAKELVDMNELTGAAEWEDKRFIFFPKGPHPL